MGERAVVFKLTTEVDPKAQAIVDAFSKRMVSAQAQVTKAVDGGAAAQVKAAEKSAQAQAKATERAAQKAEQERIRETRIAEREAAKQVAAKERQTARELAAGQKAAERAERERAKETKAAEREAARQTAAAEREAAKQTQIAEREKAKQAAASQRASQRAIQEAERNSAREAAAQDRSAEKYKGLQDSIRSTRRETAQAALEMTGSVMQVARGITALGLVGEKDLKKVTDALLLVQGGFDLVGGAVKIIIGIDKVMDGLRKTTIATAAAQELLNAAQARGAVTGAAAAGGGARAAAGGIMGAAGGLATRVGASGVGAGVTGVAGTVAAGAAAVAGVLFGLAGTIGAARNAIKNGIGGGAAEGSFTNSVGSSRWNPFAWMMAGNMMSTNATTQETIGRARSLRESRLSEQADLQARLGQLNTTRMDLQSQSSNLMEARLDNRLNRAAIGKGDLEGLQAQRSILMASINSRTAEQELAPLLERRLANERAILDVTRQASQERLEGERQAFQLIQSRIEAEQQGRRSGAERFAMLGQAEQAELLSVYDRVSRGQTQGLTPEQLSKAKGFDSGLDSLVSQELEARGNQAGFDRIAEASKRREEGLREMQAEIQTNMDYEVDLQFNAQINYDKIASEISVQLDSQISSDIDKIAQKVVETNDQIAYVTRRLTNLEESFSRQRNGGSR